MSWQDILKISRKEWAKIPKDKREEAWAKLPSSEKRALANEIEGPRKKGKTKRGKKFRQTRADIDAGEIFDEVRYRRRGTPEDAGNRGGKLPEKPVQENPETMNYRQHLGPVFGLINRIVPKHETWALRDKKNNARHLSLVKDLTRYMHGAKQMIKEAEGSSKDWDYKYENK